MSDLSEQFNDLLFDIDKKLNEILYNIIKYDGEDKGDYWFLETLELRLFYDGEQTKVIKYEYTFDADEEDDEIEWEEDLSGNLERHMVVTKNEYLEKIDEYIFEKESIIKKIEIITEVLK